MRFTSPSQFISTLCYSNPTIYGNPTLKTPAPKQQASTSAVKLHDHLPHTSATAFGQAQSNNILDFSVKKGSSDASQSRVNALNFNVNVNVKMDELLDLSAKPGSHSTTVGHNNNIFHNLADIPPPNAMNKLGLRLTSEVTLFPSHSGRQQLVPTLNNKPHKRDKESASARNSSGRSSDQQSSMNQQQPPQFNSSSQRRQPAMGNSTHIGPMLGLGLPNNTNTNSKSNAMTNSNPHVWRPLQTNAPSSSSNSSKVPAFSVEPNLYVNSTQRTSFGHNEKSTKPSPPTHGMDRLPSSQHHNHNNHQSQTGRTSNSSLKVSQQLAALQQERAAAAAAAAVAAQGRESRDKERERARELEKWTNLGAANLGQYMQPNPYYPKIDPATNPYMQMYSSQFMMPPANLFGLPPGTLEQFQLYKDLLLQQQGLQQAPYPGWPGLRPPESKDRGSNK